MRRRLFAIFSVVSLLLCLGLAWLWISAPSHEQQGIATTRDGPTYFIFTDQRWPSVITAGRLDAWKHSRALGLSRSTREGKHVVGAYSLSFFLNADAYHYLTGSDSFWMKGTATPTISRKLINPASGEAEWQDISVATSPVRGSLVYLKFWQLITLLLVLPASNLAAGGARRLRRRRRRLNARCQLCGYDLRATPGRCPECGAVREKT